MLKKLKTIITLTVISIVLISWGGVGHSLISQNASLSFNSEMNDFNAWTSYLSTHASDADERKYTNSINYDPNEARRHYIDIDNYTDFISTGEIEQNYEAAVVKYGQSAINSNGTLPWATEVAFDSLRNSMKRFDWAKAKQFAADLGHYVADGHMPLHITDNYNGQNTGNTGIHSRYESTMIGNNSSLITYTGTSATNISNVNQYIFDYIYYNNKYVDSILIADNYAKSISGGSTTSSVYYDAIWSKTNKYTIKLFKNGSHALAELIYTAWVQAGKPSLTRTSIDDLRKQTTEMLVQNSPNPFTNHTTIKYNLSENSDVTLQIKDILGNTVAKLFKGSQTLGKYNIEWYPQNQPEGIYFVTLDTKKIHAVKKILLTK